MPRISQISALIRSSQSQMARMRPAASRGALLFSLVALIALAGCGGASTPAADTGGAATPTATSASPATATPTIPANATTIKITGAVGSFAFEPSSVTITAGSTVVWMNTSGVAHTATSDSGDAITWDSNVINPGGGAFSFVFSKPGTYAYHCSFHPYMHGTIIVKG
ncbi:MAG TPA: plastocyanin/azurin family copper-binding protein [Ktedonobacterales bacterium]